MKKTVRRKYTDEFRDEAVKLVTTQGYKITEAARNLGIHDSLLRKRVSLRFGFIDSVKKAYPLVMPQKQAIHMTMMTASVKPSVSM